MSLDWGFRRAFVTGGGSGIGRRFASLLAQDGAELALFDLKFTSDARREIEERARARVHFYEVDVTDARGLRCCIDHVVERIGAPDLALHVAGIQNAKPFEDLSDEEYEHVIRVNLLGSRNFARATLPHLQRGAHLGLVASLAGLVPVYAYTAYGASKAGVVGLAGSLRIEYAPKGIAVSVICPPEVPTPLVDEEKRTMHPATREQKKLVGSLSTMDTCTESLRELRRGTAVIIPGIRAKAAVALLRFVPAPAVNWITDGIVRRALARQSFSVA